MRTLLRLASFAVFLSLFVPCRIAADSAVRLTDLAPGDDDGLDDLDAAVLGDFLYFVGDAAGNQGLYRYDGVNAPTLVPDSAAARPHELVVWQNRLYFQGGPSGDRELWEYDPAGPSLGEAVDVRASGNGSPQRIAALAGEICFGAFSDTFGFELHCWDGSGLATVYDLETGPGSSFPTELTAWNDGLALVRETAEGSELLFYDGSGMPEPIAAGPGAPFTEPCCLAGAPDGLYFVALSDDEQYRLFRCVPPAAPVLLSTTFEPYGEIGAFRGQMITDGADPSLGLEDSEMWRLVAGALRRVRPGTSVTSTTGHVEAASALYFSGYPEGTSNDLELYKYCGAGAIGPATTAWAGDEATVTTSAPLAWNGKVYVSAFDATFGEELWAVTPSHLFCDDFETGGTASWP